MGTTTWGGGNWGGATNLSDSGVQISSLIYHALRLAGVTLAPGRTPSSDQFADGLLAFNRMMDSWSAYRANIWSIKQSAYSLFAGQAQYGLGPGGDLDATRPQRITRANVVDGDDHIRLELVQEEQWSEIRKPTETGRPTRLWPDMQAPLAVLNFYPVPDADYGLELFTWEPIGTVSAKEDRIAFPPAYEQAIVDNLGVHLCQMFGKPVHPDLRESAKISLGNLRRMNLPTPIMDSDLPGTRHGSYSLQSNTF